VKKVYVLAKQHPHMGGAVTFVCGDPRMPSFSPVPEPASQFEEIEDALLYRAVMPHLLGGTGAYRVHELLLNGQIIDVEP